MDKLEELVRRWRDTAMNHSAENPYTAGEQIGLLGCAEDISALRRDYVLVPREPTQEDVERVALRLHLLLGHRDYVVPAEREPFTSMPEPWQEDFKAMSELLWAAIVGEGTSGGTDEA